MSRISSLNYGIFCLYSQIFVAMADINLTGSVKLPALVNTFLTKCRCTDGTVSGLANETFLAIECWSLLVAIAVSTQISSLAKPIPAVLFIFVFSPVT